MLSLVNNVSAQDDIDPNPLDPIQPTDCFVRESKCAPISTSLPFHLGSPFHRPNMDCPIQICIEQELWCGNEGEKVLCRALDPICSTIEHLGAPPASEFKYTKIPTPTPEGCNCEIKTTRVVISRPDNPDPNGLIPSIVLKGDEAERFGRIMNGDFSAGNMRIYGSISGCDGNIVDVGFNFFTSTSINGSGNIYRYLMLDGIF